MDEWKGLTLILCVLALWGACTDSKQNSPARENYFIRWLADIFFNSVHIFEKQVSQGSSIFLGKLSIDGKPGKKSVPNWVWFGLRWKTQVGILRLPPIQLTVLLGQMITSKFEAIANTVSMSSDISASLKTVILSLRTLGAEFISSCQSYPYCSEIKWAVGNLNISNQSVNCV